MTWGGYSSDPRNPLTVEDVLASPQFSAAVMAAVRNPAIGGSLVDRSVPQRAVDTPVGTALPLSPRDKDEFYLIVDSSASTIAHMRYRASVARWEQVGVPPLVTTLPATATAPDGLEVYYVADSANGVVWHLRYRRAGSATYPWEYVGGPPLHHTIITSESTTSTTFTNLATAGPLITFPRSGFYDLRMGARITAASGQAGLMTIATATIAAADANALLAGGSASTVDTSPSIEHRFEAAAADSVTAKYRSSGGGSMSFATRWMRLTPVRVG